MSEREWLSASESAAAPPVSIVFPCPTSSIVGLNRRVILPALCELAVPQKLRRELTSGKIASRPRDEREGAPPAATGDKDDNERHNR